MENEDGRIAPPSETNVLDSMSRVLATVELVGGQPEKWRLSGDDRAAIMAETADNGAIRYDGFPSTVFGLPWEDAGDGPSQLVLVPKDTTHDHS